MELVIIAAVAEAPGHPMDRLIGDGLDLPWHLPADLRRFKALTLGHPLVMGRRTFAALVHQFGGPLPGRETVVLTRAPERLGESVGDVAQHPDVRAFASLDEALAAYASRERVFIGGGAAVYAAALADGPDGRPRADRLELTFVEGVFQGDTFFPPFRERLAEHGGPFVRTAVEVHAAEGERPAFRFETFLRTPNAAG